MKNGGMLIQNQIEMFKKYCKISVPIGAAVNWIN